MNHREVQSAFMTGHALEFIDDISEHVDACKACLSWIDRYEAETVERVAQQFAEARGFPSSDRHRDIAFATMDAAFDSLEPAGSPTVLQFKIGGSQIRPIERIRSESSDLWYMAAAIAPPLPEGPTSKLATEGWPRAWLHEDAGIRIDFELRRKDSRYRVYMSGGTIDPTVKSATISWEYGSFSLEDLREPVDLGPFRQFLQSEDTRSEFRLDAFQVTVYR